MNKEATLSAARSANLGQSGLNIDLDKPVILQVYDSAENPIPPDGSTDDLNLRLTGTAVGASTVSIYDGSTKMEDVDVAPIGLWTYLSYNLEPTVHVFTARGVDGQSSDPWAVTVKLKAPTISSITDSQGNEVESEGSTTDRSLSFFGEATPGDEISIYDGASYMGSVQAHPSEGIWRFDLIGLSLSTHAFTARASDDQASPPWIVCVDPQAGDTPIDAAQDSSHNNIENGGSTEDTSLTLFGSATAKATVTIYDDGDLIATEGPIKADDVGSWKVTLSDLKLKQYVFTALTSDNKPSNFWRVNVKQKLEAPDIYAAKDSSDGEIENGGDTYDNSLTLFGSATPKDTLTLYDGSGPVETEAPIVADDGGFWKVQLSNLPFELHVFTARSSDGQPSGPWSINVKRKLRAPVIEVAKDSDGNEIENEGTTEDTSVTLFGSATYNDTVTLFDGGAPVVTDEPITVNERGLWSVTLSSLESKRHFFTAQSSDGQPSDVWTITVESANTLRIDGVKELPSNTPILDGGSTTATQLFIHGNAPGLFALKVYFNEEYSANTPVEDDGSWRFETVTLKPDTYRFMVKSPNEQQQSNVWQVTVEAPGKRVN